MKARPLTTMISVGIGATIDANELRDLASSSAFEYSMKTHSDLLDVTLQVPIPLLTLILHLILIHFL